MTTAMDVEAKEVKIARPVRAAAAQAANAIATEQERTRHACSTAGSACHCPCSHLAKRMVACRECGHLLCILCHDTPVEAALCCQCRETAVDAWKKQLLECTFAPEKTIFDIDGEYVPEKITCSSGKNARESEAYVRRTTGEYKSVATKIQTASAYLAKATTSCLIVIDCGRLEDRDAIVDGITKTLPIGDITWVHRTVYDRLWCPPGNTRQLRGFTVHLPPGAPVLGPAADTSMDALFS